MNRRAACLAALVLAVACSAKTPAITSTPSERPSPSLSATKAAQRVPVARQAVYALDGSIYTYDVAANLTTKVAVGDGVRLPHWVSNTQISFVQGEPGSANALRLLDVASRKVSDVFTVETGINVYGWSPDRQTVAYITTDRLGYPHLRYREVETGVNQSVATLARALGREGSISDQALVQFSADGADVLVVYTPADGEDPSKVPDDQSQFQIRALDGTLDFSVGHKRAPTMGVWSADGKTIYYLTSSGLRSWKEGKQTSTGVKGSVKWFDPWPSPDGRSIAFDTGAAGAGVKVRALDLTTGAKADVTKGGFFHPVWAAPQTIWVQKVTPCSPDCLTPVVAAPEVDAVDLKTRKVTKLALTSLQDIDVRYA
ncbi:MAG: hypothetical protein ABR552_02995 [Actinomycetota bacterium]